MCSNQAISGLRPVRALKAAGILLILLALSGCSSLKMSSLRDARILKRGDFGISGQGATTADEYDAILVTGRETDSALASLSGGKDSSGLFKHMGGVPLVGLGFALGLGGGYEIHGGVDIAYPFIGGLMADVGLKRRFYTGPRLLLSGYGRVAMGIISNEFVPYESSGETIWKFEASSWEVDAQFMVFVRFTRVLGWYLNAGPTVGKITYEFARSTDPIEGTAPLRGFKTHTGLAFEKRRFEMAFEWGSHFYDFGFVPSLGFRAGFKLGWSE